MEARRSFGAHILIGSFLVLAGGALLLGLWFAVPTLHIGGLTFSDTWPAIFIAIGLSMLWKSLPDFP